MREFSSRYGGHLGPGRESHTLAKADEETQGSRAEVGRLLNDDNSYDSQGAAPNTHRDFPLEKDFYETETLRSTSEQNEALQYSTLQPGPQLISSAGINAKSRRVHILGTDETGKFVAHCLAGISARPPITLLMHRQHLRKEWYEGGEMLELVKDRRSDLQIGFDVEGTDLTQAEHAQGRMMSTKTVLSGESGWFIDKLIVTTPATITAQALAPIRDRLRPTSTIVFLQNTMGVIEQVNKRVFQNPDTRPQYVLGLITHGLNNHPSKSFTTGFYRSGDVLLSSLRTPRTALERWPESCNSLLRMLVRSTALNATGVHLNYLLTKKLDHLAVDAIIGPLSVMFDCKIGELRANFMVTSVVKDLLEEISAVILALPELKDYPDLVNLFNPGLLQKRVNIVMEKSCDEIHPMLRQVRKGGRTEIGYINGYILKRAMEVGISCPANTQMVRLVKAKQAMKSREKHNYIPWEEPKE